MSCITKSLARRESRNVPPVAGLPAAFSTSDFRNVDARAARLRDGRAFADGTGFALGFIFLLSSTAFDPARHLRSSS
jgi:hypothetical protein